MNASLPTGMQINRFKLESEIGRGGMGVVYRAADPVLKRPVALKLLAPHLGSDASALARFHREAELVAGLKHSHIAIVYEFGEVEDRPYIAMEWIEGRDLKTVMENEGPLSLERSLKLFRQLAAALDYAHQQGVIHRDLKPANIIIGPDDHATIVDFGLAWLETAPTITVSGSILGTPRYMSPEQIEGGSVDSRSDLYSLALILYEMLAGKPPFDSPSPSALLHQQLFVPPPPITEINPAIPADVEAALMKALSKNPDDRFQSAQEFQIGLAPADSTLSMPPPGRKKAPLRRTLQRYKWLLVAGVVLLAAAGLTIASLPNLFSDARHPAPANTAPSSAILPTRAPVPTSTPDPDDEAISSSDEPRAWGMSVGDPLRMHFVEIPFLPFASEPRWAYYPDGSSQTDLAGAGGLIVFSTTEGVVQALNWTNGEGVWDTRLGVEIAVSPALYVDNESAIALLPTVDGALYALNLADARLLWRIDAEALGGVIQSMTIDYGDKLIAVTDTGRLHVIDPFSGDIYGALNLGEDYASVYPPALSDTAFFIAANSHIAYTLEVVTESIAWESGITGRPSTSPLGDGGWGYVVVGTDENWIHAFSSLTGQRMWEFELDSPVVGLAADWERLYAATANGSLHAWYAWGNEEAWTVELETTITSGPITNGDYLLIGTGDGEILTLSVETGEVQGDRTLTLDEPVFSLMPTGDWLFVRAGGGIYAFSPKDGD